MSQRTKSWVLCAGFVAWLMLIGCWIGLLHSFEFEPGPTGNVPRKWPITSRLIHDLHQPALLVFFHPKCPCNNASVEKMEVLLQRAARPVDVKVVFTLPPGAPDDWTQTPLARKVAAIRGIQVVWDRNGIETLRFGVRTSSHTLFYDERQTLCYDGGIAWGRGQGGAHPLEIPFLELLDGRVRSPAIPLKSGVYGCRLFD